MAKPGPLHIALDNLSVVNGVQDILDGTQRSRRPWALRADGDLWTIAEQAINIRGASPIKVAWTKGHATWIHFLQGISTHRGAIGNCYADAAADQGHKAAGRHDEQAVLSHINEMQMAYTQLMQWQS